MPLILDASALSEETLRELVRSLREDLKEMEEPILRPSARVLDPASLRTAEELLSSARAILDRPGVRDRVLLVAEANLAYAVLLALIDLLKSHTDVPKVPPPRPVRPPGPAADNASG